jgi:hypothetical protein
MQTTTDHQKNAIAEAVASTYRHLHWVGTDEVKAAALLAIVEAEATFNRMGHSDSIVTYLRRAGQYAAHEHVWRVTSPVHVGDKALLAQVASEARRESTDTIADRPDSEEAPDDLLARLQWCDSVRRRFDELLRDDAECDKAIARRVLLEEEKPEAVAVAEAVPVRAVYVVTKRISQRIFKDDEMLRLLAEVC